MPAKRTPQQPSVDGKHQNEQRDEATHEGRGRVVKHRAVALERARPHDRRHAPQRHHAECHAAPSALCFHSGRETLPHSSPRSARPAKTSTSSMEQRNAETTMAYIVTKSKNKPTHNRHRNTLVRLIEQGMAPSRTERPGKADREDAPNKAARTHARNRAAKGRQGANRR